METEPEQETIAVTPATKQYLEALHEAGLLPRQGDRGLDGQVEQVMRALHAVLAGGDVSIEVADTGPEGIASDLDELLAKAAEETRGLDPDIAYF